MAAGDIGGLHAVLVGGTVERTAVAVLSTAFPISLRL